MAMKNYEFRIKHKKFLKNCEIYHFVVNCHENEPQYKNKTEKSAISI